MSIVDRNIYGWTLSTGLIALCSLLYFSREPSITLHPGLYAEDGSIFLQAAIDSGSSSLAQPYAGYSHLLQRLAALFAVGWMSPLNYPSFFLAVAWASYLLPLVCVEVLIHSRMAPVLARISYLPYVSYPYAAETYLNLPNSYIFFGLGFILIAYAVYGVVLSAAVDGSPVFGNRPACVLLRGLVLIYGSIAALTGPFTAIYCLPLLIYSIIRTRWRASTFLFVSLPIAVSTVQILLSQGLTVYPLSTVEALRIVTSRPDLLQEWISIHLVGPLYGGHKASHYLAWLPVPRQTFIAIATALLLLRSLVVIGAKSRIPGLFWLAAFSTLLIACSGLVVSLRRGSPYEVLVTVDGGGRFFFWSTVYFLTIPLLAWIKLASSRSTRRTFDFWILSVWLISACILYSDNMFPRTPALDYARQLRGLCRQPDPASVDIHIYPRRDWRFHLDAPQIRKLCSS